MNDKERLKKVLCGEENDRPPCICPGGMMNMITTDLMDECGVSWPEAHTDAALMAKLAAANYEKGCFENVGVPFCMTIEAEALGAKVTMGNKIHEPHVTEYAINSVEELDKVGSLDVTKGRAKTVTDAITILKSMNPEVPIVGNLTGPVSTASSVMEPTVFYKEIRKKRGAAHRYMQYVTNETIKFARAQAMAGADVITISDPSGTGEILGPKLFEEFTVRYVNQIIDSLDGYNVGTIVHICGQMHNVYSQADKLHAQALSFDSCVALTAAKKEIKNHPLMGNVSTVALEFGDPEKVGKLAVNCWKNGSAIISPACGLGTKSPLSNIRAIRNAIVQEYARREANG